MDVTGIVLSAAVGALVGAVTGLLTGAGLLQRMYRKLVRREDETRAAVERLTHAVAAGEQAWFWTPEWQAGEQAAEEEIARGDTMAFGSADEFDAHLNRITESYNAAA